MHVPSDLYENYKSLSVNKWDPIWGEEIGLIRRASEHKLTMAPQTN